MKTEKQNLMIEHLDKKYNRIKNISSDLIAPDSGWINTVRTVLNMSLKQLSRRLKVSPQNINQLEIRERDETISIGKLRAAADALNMNFVYAFIPKDGTITSMIDKRALQVARDIVLRTSNSMGLEAQKNTEERLEKAIKDRAEKIKQEMPKHLWD
jgi:predicted DNA-binding mobile mystery protein A